MRVMIVKLWCFATLLGMLAGAGILFATYNNKYSRTPETHAFGADKKTAIIVIQY